MLFYKYLVLFYVFLCCSMYCLFCVVLCIVCVYMCTELLPPGGYPIAVKYIISYIISISKITPRQAYCVSTYLPVRVRLMIPSRGMRWHNYSLACKRGREDTRRLCSLFHVSSLVSPRSSRRVRHAFCKGQLQANTIHIA